MRPRPQHQPLCLLAGFVLACCAPSLARSQDAGHVRWTVQVEPAEIAPGGEGTLVAKYELTKGWHLYSPDHAATGQKTVLELAPGSIELSGEHRFPDPIIHEDKVLEETHRWLKGTGEVRRTFRVADDAKPGQQTLQALLSFMTCTEEKCDLPVRKRPYEFTLTVAAAKTEMEEEGKSATSDTGTSDAGNAAGGIDIGFPGGDAFGSVGTSLAGGDGHKASFSAKVSSREVDRGREVILSVAYKVEDGWYIYAPNHEATGEPTSLSIEYAGVSLTDTQSFPKPIRKEDTLLKETQLLLEGKGEITQGFIVSDSTDPGELTFQAKVDFMTCNKKDGTCLPPTSVELPVTITVSDAAPANTPSSASTETGEVGTPEDEDYARMGLGAFLLAMMGGGLIALVMPCTYPMIPLTISMFTKQAEARNGSVLLMALFYGAGIILCFVVIGLVIGEPIIQFAQTWQINLVFGIAFIFFALSFFGLFTLRLPSFVNNIAGKAGGASGYLGVFLLGLTLVITSFTCTAPVVGGLLALSATGAGHGRIALGMCVFGATLALPFVLLALFPARVRSLPRSGEWMHTIKVYLGFLELAAAFKFLSMADIAYFGGADFVLSREFCLLLWTVILGVAGIYLLGIFRMRDEQNEGVGTVRMLFGVAHLVIALYFFQGSYGYRLDKISDALAPPPRHDQVLLDVRAPGGAGRTLGPSGDSGPKEDGVSKAHGWTQVTDDVEKGFELATREGKRALINFTGHT